VRIPGDPRYDVRELANPRAQGHVDTMQSGYLDSYGNDGAHKAYAPVPSFEMYDIRAEKKLPEPSTHDLVSITQAMDHYGEPVPDLQVEEQVEYDPCGLNEMFIQQAMDEMSLGVGLTDSFAEEDPVQRVIREVEELDRKRQMPISMVIDDPFERGG